MSVTQRAEIHRDLAWRQGAVAIPDLMLRAALIGFPSSGKSTLFQLMTSVKGDALGARQGRERSSASRRCPTSGSIVSSRCTSPESGCLQPSSSPISRRRHAGAHSAGRRCCLQERRRARPRPSGISGSRRAASATRSIDPARDARQMEDELILADLGVAERRLERLERDSEESRTRGARTGARLADRCQAALEEGNPLRALDLEGDTKAAPRVSVPLRQAAPIVINLSESDTRGRGANRPTRPRRRPG